jgi:hypothetical protein
MNDELKGPRGQREKVFTQEEVNAILSRAVEHQNPRAGGLTYAELVDSARQAGIDAGAIEAAVLDLGERGETSLEDDRVAAEVARRKWRAWRGFSLHFTVFAMFSVLIAFINLHEGGDLYFPIPILGWGIAIAAHFMAVFFPSVFPSPDRDEKIRRELRKRDERVQRREKREEKKEKRLLADNGELKESAKELGVAMQRGMAVILSDVAKSIHEEVDRANRGSSKPGVRVDTKPRVDAPDDEDEDEKRATRRR